MSGSAGGNRIPRSAVEKTVQEYIDKVLSKIKGFKSAKVSGSYNTSAKQDFGDIDLITAFEGEDKKEFKKTLAKHLESLPDDIIVPFKSEKYKGKKSLNTGEIVTILYPITGMPGEFVQIDNIIALSEEEGEFKKTFLDYPAEVQGLILGLVKVVLLEEDPKSVLKQMGITNIPPLDEGQEYEFNLSSAGLTLRIVTLDQDFRQIDRTEVWKSSNWSDVKKLLSNFNLDQPFEKLLDSLKGLKNERSKNRIKGIFKSMVSIKSGEVGTPKGDNKQYALNKVAALEERYGSLAISLIRPILEAESKETIAIYPGGFKPPHKGHLQVIQSVAPKVDKMIVIYSTKTRQKPGQVPITADQTADIFQLYIDNGLIPGNVEIRPAETATPVQDAYEIMKANPNNNYMALYGKDEEGAWKSIEKYKQQGEYLNVVPTSVGNFGGLNATAIRTALQNNDMEILKQSLPQGVTVEEYLQALKFNPGKVQESYKGKRTNQGAPGTLKAKISKLYGGDVTIEKARKLKNRENATAHDKRQANWFINFHSKNEGLNESKQVGTIYHYTTFEAGLKILESNELKSTETADSTKSNPIYGVSFTRNKRFHNNHNVGFDVSSFGQKPQIRFTVDGDKLSNKYKMQPYAQIGGSGRFEKQHEEFEAEERAVSNKPFTIPVLTYLKSIDILIEYKKPRKNLSGEYDFEEEYDYKKYAPIRAEIIKFTQDKNLPVNLIINKNGDPWPDKEKPNLINKILNWFTNPHSKNENIEPAETSGKAAPYGSGYKKLEEELTPLIVELTQYMYKQGLSMDPAPSFEFIEDESNAQNPLGRTAFYDPNNQHIVLYITGRHPKDILRSFAHEMIHHAQNLEGRLANLPKTTDINEDDHLKEIEREAYETGNLLFRGWENNRNKQVMAEGKYDTLSNELSSKIFTRWKSDFEAGKPESHFEWFVMDEKTGLEFDLKADIEFVDQDIYSVDGGANQGSDFEDALIQAEFTVDKNALPRLWEKISFDLKDFMRHEIEHLTQSGVNLISSKKRNSDQARRDKIKAGELPTSKYATLKSEIEPMLQGMYFSAKKQRRPFRDVVEDWFDARGFTTPEKVEILKTWKPYLKRLSLPNL